MLNSPVEAVAEAGALATSMQIGLHLQNTCATDLCTKVLHFSTSWVHSERLLTQPLGMYSVVDAVVVVTVVVEVVVDGVVLFVVANPDIIV